MEIKSIIFQAIATLNKNKTEFIKNFLPTIFVVMVGVSGMYFTDFQSQMEQGKPEAKYFLLIFVFIVIFLIFISKSIVHTHRTFILNEKSRLVDLFKLRRRDFRFIKKFIALNIIMIIIGIILMVLFGSYLIELAQGSENQAVIFLIGLVTALMTAFVWSRLAIVLPSAALDHGLSIQRAWHVSDDYSGKLFVGVGILPVITDVVISYFPNYDSIIYTVITSLIWCVVAIVEIGVLSLLYKEITKDKASTV